MKTVNHKTSSQKSDEEKNFSNRSLKRLSKLESKSDSLEKEYRSQDKDTGFTPDRKQIKSLKKQVRVEKRINKITKKQKAKGRTNLEYTKG